MSKKKLGKAVITCQEMEDGNVSIDIHCDPPINFNKPPKEGIHVVVAKFIAAMQQAIVPASVVVTSDRK